LKNFGKIIFKNGLRRFS